MNLVISLDISDQHNLVHILDQARSYEPMIKIGHILLSQWHSSYSEPLSHFPIFLDFKFLDIPNTVITALRNYKKLFPSLTHYTIHGTAEENLVKACCNEGVATPISVISLSSNHASQDTSPFLKHVERNISLGINNFVCPPNQIDAMKQRYGADVTLFVPGIRNSDVPSNDHFSTVTAQQAKAKGVDYAIVGRPIVDSLNITQAIQAYSV